LIDGYQKPISGNGRKTLNDQRTRKMTTITYRDSKSSSGLHFDVGGLLHKASHAWHQWQAAREIESMPFDIRKDVGYPSAEAADDRKDM